MYNVKQSYDVNTVMSSITMEIMDCGCGTVAGPLIFITDIVILLITSISSCVYNSKQSGDVNIALGSTIRIMGGCGICNHKYPSLILIIIVISH